MSRKAKLVNISGATFRTSAKYFSFSFDITSSTHNLLYLFFAVSVQSPNEKTTDALLCYCIATLQGCKDLELAYNTAVSIKFSAVIHSGNGVAGYTTGESEVPRYRLVSKSVNTTLKLMKKSRPNSILITEDCAKLIKDKENKTFIELSRKFVEVEKNMWTYWLASI